MDSVDISHSEEILTVTQLTREARLVLEGTFPLIWVEGEISNFTAPQSGHWYFSLKDANSQVRCAMFRTQNRRLTFAVKDGTQVLVKAKVSLYEGRGDFQLLVEFMEDIGQGKLQKAFEALKKKLAVLGLFDATHKKSLPLYPTTIGVITSPTGAAIRDILSVLKRRYPIANIVIYPSLVQGEQAATTLVAAIETANQRNECDVLILARGGGSIEDLWPFNEERVAYAIHKSTLPIITGVGHEIDFTIADFVADQRAPTPSAAAELITPNRIELLETLEKNKQRLIRLINEKLHLLSQQLTWTEKQLQQKHPKQQLREQQQKLDYAEMELIRLLKTRLSQTQASIATFKEKLFAYTPIHLIQSYHQTLILHTNQLTHLIQSHLQSQQHSLATLASKLNALSPLTTLQRGFSIATRESDHAVLLSRTQVKPGDKIKIQLYEGNIGCVVTE